MPLIDLCQSVQHLRNMSVATVKAFVGCLTHCTSFCQSVQHLQRSVTGHQWPCSGISFELPVTLCGLVHTLCGLPQVLCELPQMLCGLPHKVDGLPVTLCGLFQTLYHLLLSPMAPVVHATSTPVLQ